MKNDTYTDFFRIVYEYAQIFGNRRDGAHRLMLLNEWAEHAKKVLPFE